MPPKSNSKSSDKTSKESKNNSTPNTKTPVEDISSIPSKIAYFDLHTFVIILYLYLKMKIKIKKIMSFIISFFELFLF
jgi:hypothetical protein